MTDSKKTADEVVARVAETFAHNILNEGFCAPSTGSLLSPEEIAQDAEPMWVPFEWASEDDRLRYEHDVTLHGQGFARERADGRYEHVPLEEVLG